MKRLLWQGIGAAFVLGSLSLGTISCSSQQQQQAEDQIIENEENEEQEGQDQEYSENSSQQGEEGYQGNNAENYNSEENYAGNEAQEAQQQDELQEIIDGMNQQQASDGNGLNNQYAGDGNGLNAQYAEGNTEVANGANLEQGQGMQEPVGDGETMNSSAEDAAPMDSQMMGSEAEQQVAAAGLAAAPGLPELGSKMSYVVGTGDTLASIAMKIYGDLEKWREIAEFTGMANPNMIYPGDVVYYQLTDQTMAFASAYESVARAEVVVQPGDTLSTIASNVLGSSQDWKMIWRQNDNIDDPDDLTVGQTLYYVNPGMLSAAIDSFKNKVIVAKKAVEKKVEIVSNSVKTIKNDGVLLASDLESELQKDFAALNGAGFARVI